MEGGRRRRREGCRVMECSSPRRILVRWLSGLRSVRGRREKDAGVGGDDVAPVRCSMNFLNHCSNSVMRSSGTEVAAESHRRDASPDMAIGYFLLYLVAASKNELDKMVKLRNQMETLLKSAEEEMQMKELQTKTLSSNHAYKCSTKDGHEGPRSYNHHFSPQVVSASFGLEDSSSSMICDQSSKPDDVSKPGHHPMDQVESEVEAETEILHIDAEANKKYQKHPKHRKAKVAIKDAASTRNQISGSGDVNDEVIYHHEVNSDVNYGVCPYELGRKLHELLETRQQEQIRELEAAVRRVQRRLHEKETEVSWWKDAASLLSQRVPESSRTGLERCVPESIITGLEHCVPETGLELCGQESSRPDSEHCVQESARAGSQPFVPESSRTGLECLSSRIF